MKEETLFQALQTLLQKQLCIIAGTGASCAVDKRFGMPALAAHLQKTLPDLIKDRGLSAHGSEWTQIDKDLSEPDPKGLEESLNGLTPASPLIPLIVQTTGDFLASIDGKIASDPAAKERHGLSRFIASQFRNQGKSFTVITPNYDLNIERGLDHFGVRYHTGFVGGLHRQLDLVEAKAVYRQAAKGRARAVPQVELLKVHGSLNWFIEADQRVLEKNDHTYQPRPYEVKRALITPGDSKFEHILINDVYRTLLPAADEAINKANVFVVVGYGFNDLQWDQKILKHAKQGRASLVVITWDRNEALIDKAKDWPNAWLIFAENEGKDSVLIHQGEETPLTGRNLVDLNVFTKEVLGG